MRYVLVICLTGLALLVSGGDARAQCVEQGPFQNNTGLGQVACPCFVVGEQAGESGETLFRLSLYLSGENGTGHPL